MRAEGVAFGVVAIFLIPVTVAYGLLTKGEEPIGVVALIMALLLMAMISGYVLLQSRANGKRPEDRKNGEIHEAAGDVGFFPPRSIWPLFLALTLSGFVLGPVFGWWIAIVSGAFGAVTLTGWLFEFYRGDHAH